MRGIVPILLAGLLMPLAAAAQEWQTYAYPDSGFTIDFPAPPAVETGTIKNATGVSLPLTRYAVRHERINYTLSVVNYSSTNADALTTIIETERSLNASGKVTVASGARVSRNFGRELTLNSTDGSRSAIAIFFVDKHLYTVVGQALPPNVDEEMDEAIRFQESLRFPEDHSGFRIFFGGTGPSRPKSAYNPPADAACTGKSAGEAVQLQTPRGPVPATCTLVAKPNMPTEEKP
jgi:hypothetical protein